MMSDSTVDQMSTKNRHVYACPLQRPSSLALHKAAYVLCHAKFAMTIANFGHIPKRPVQRLIRQHTNLTARAPIYTRNVSWQELPRGP